jgi:excisionase family DNA binding protein
MRVLLGGFEMRTQKGWKTVRETAKILRLGINQTYKAVAKGDIRAVRIGNSWRIPDAELDRLQYGETAA